MPELRASAVVLNSLLLGTAAGVVGYTQSSVFASAGDDPRIDRIAEKAEAKSRFRRPVNETINELGEGRGSSPDLLVLLSCSQPYRHLWTRIRRKKETASEGEVRY